MIQDDFRKDCYKALDGLFARHPRASVSQLVDNFSSVQVSVLRDNSSVKAPQVTKEEQQKIVNFGIVGYGPHGVEDIEVPLITHKFTLSTAEYSTKDGWFQILDYGQVYRYDRSHIKSVRADVEDARNPLVKITIERYPELKDIERKPLWIALP